MASLSTTCFSTSPDRRHTSNKFTGDASTRKGEVAIYTMLKRHPPPFENLDFRDATRKGSKRGLGIPEWHRRCGVDTLPDNGWSEYAKQVQILPDATLLTRQYEDTTRNSYFMCDRPRNNDMGTDQGPKRTRRI